MAVLTSEQISRLPAQSKTLELGCGQIRRFPNSTTLDYNEASIADVIHDLNVFPYPFEDNTFDFIVAEHVIEHLGPVISVMTELHRITKPGGIIYIEVPHFTSANFFTDPTHTHSFTSRSFNYFIEGTPVRQFHYSPAELRLRDVRVTFSSNNPLFKRMHNWAQRNIEQYERRFAFYLQAEHLNFELEVVK